MLGPLAACASVPDPAPEVAVDVAGGSLTPESRARLLASVDSQITDRKILGAVTAIARPDALLWYEAQGARDYPALTPLAADAIFNMMSSTKVVTSIAVLQLVEQGRMSLDDKVSRYLPTFASQKVVEAPEGWQAQAADPEKRQAVIDQIRLVPAERDITIKDLLTHTAGLSAAYGLGMGAGSLVNPAIPGSREMTLAERIPQLGALALDFQPGSRFGYSPLDGMDTLLHIVELVSGQDAQTWLDQTLFAPLEMTDTYFSVPASKQSRVLPLYGAQDGTFVEHQPLLGTGPTRYYSGGAGLLSTARDFLNLHLMLLQDGGYKGRRLLRPETVRLMTTNQVGTLYAEWVPFLSKGMGFGLGVGVVIDPEESVTGRGLGAFGWGGGYGTEAWVEPEKGVAACHFVQNATPQPPGPAPYFARALREVL